MHLPHCVASFYNLPWFFSIMVSNKILQRNAVNTYGNRMCKRTLNYLPDFWIELLNTTFSTPRVLLLAYPSEELDMELMGNETKRVAKQVKKILMFTIFTCLEYVDIDFTKNVTY